MTSLSPPSDTPDEAAQRRQTEELLNTPPEAVTRAAHAASGMTPDEEEGHKRKHRNDTRAAAAGIKKFGMRTAAFLAALLAVSLLVLTIWALYRWTANLLADPLKLDKVVTGAVFTVIGACVTLALQSIGRSIFKDGE